MHDIDRALFELESEGEYEGETLELELATELLEIGSEAELDRFLGSLLSKAVDVGKSFLDSGTGRAVTGLVRRAAKSALPQIGQAIGNYVAPGVGGKAGQQAGAWLGGALGLELEGLSHEDRELEVSKAFVRFAQTAATEAARLPQSLPPQLAARRAVVLAAKRHLPGLLPQLRQIAATRGTRPAVAPAPVARPAAPAASPVAGEWEAGEFEFEYESEAAAEYEGEGEYEFEAELAQELLEITTEAELDRFLGKLVSGVAKFAKSGVGKAIGGVLKNVAKTALPMVGSALGSFVMPGVGTAIGGQLGSMASKLLEVGELEAMSESEAEFEAALRFVRFGRDAARLAATAPRSVPPQAAARAAAIAAARRNAPRLLRPTGPRNRSRNWGGNWRDRRDGRTAYRGSRGYRRPAWRRSARWQWGPTDWAPWGGDADGWGPAGPDWADEPGGADPGDAGDEAGESGFEFE